MAPDVWHNGLLYRGIKHLVNFGLRAYFGKIVIKGRENLPDGQSYILAPNHQNAFLDALMILQLNRFRPTVFLARADIFASTAARKVLGFLKIMPVYRARDGRQSLANNDAIFHTAVEVISRQVPFCMMAEGTHNDRRQLLPLKKGLCRIAFAAKLQTPEKPLYIVPVGIDYESYSMPGRQAVINIGKPIAVDGYMELYHSGNAVAVNALKEDLRKGITSQMHNIQSAAHYNEFYLLSKLHADHLGGDAWNRFENRRRLTRRLDGLETTDAHSVEKLCEATNELSAYCRDKGFPVERVFGLPRVVETVVGTMLAMGVLATVFALSWRAGLMSLLLCPVPFLPTRLLFRGQEDKQFVGSLNFAVQFLLTVLYLVAMPVFVWICQGWRYAVVALVCGVVVWRLGYILADKLKGYAEVWKVLIFNYKALKQTKHKILSVFENIGTTDN